METKNFEDKKIDTEFATKLIDWARNDIAMVEKSKGVLEILAKVEVFKEKCRILDKMEANELIGMQQRAVNYKWDIEREMQPYLAGQSYAFIFRKFYTADKYNATKDKIEKAIDDKKTKPKATVQAIDAEMEKDMVTVRKTEVIYQAINGDLEAILKWLDSMVMNIQNRLREKAQDRKTDYATQNSVQR